jgi:hypothetical protein
VVADNVNLWYYTLQDVQYGNPVPSFGIKPAGDLQFVNPLFDLSCPATANTVSYFFVLLVSSTLSPLFSVILFNLSVGYSILLNLLSAAQLHCDCPCTSTLAWAVQPSGWVARANNLAKSSPAVVSVTARVGNSIIRSLIVAKWTSEIVENFHRIVSVLTSCSATKRSSNISASNCHRACG